MIASHALTWPLLLGTLGVLAGSAYLWTTYQRASRLSPGR
jgi:hypothetical protein